MDVKISVAVLFVVCLASGVLGCLRSSSSDKGGKDRTTTTTPRPTTTASSSAWRCGYCGPPIDVTLRLFNNLTDKPFDVSYTMKKVNKQALVYLLFQAANDNEAFKFTMTHFGKQLGMFVDAINGLKNNFVTEPMGYWKILYANGTAYQVGVSNIFLEDGDNIVFNYTEYVPMHH